MSIEVGIKASRLDKSTRNFSSIGALIYFLGEDDKSPRLKYPTMVNLCPFQHYFLLLRKNFPEEKSFSPSRRFSIYHSNSMATQGACQTLAHTDSCCLITFLCSDDAHYGGQTPPPAFPLDCQKFLTTTSTSIHIATEPQ